MPILQTKPLNNRLTIFITSYNYGHYIDQAIDSVLQQTSPDWNLVILDNGSTDNTAEVVAPYLDDARISFFVRPENIGHRGNTLSGYRDLHTEFVSALQADDLLEPEFVERALQAFDQHPHVPFVAQKWKHYLEATREYSEPRTTPFPPDFQGVIRISPFLCFCNFIPLHLAVFRRACLDEALTALEQSPLQQLCEVPLFKTCEDLYGPSYYLSEVGGYWRRHDEQITNKHVGNAVASIEEPLERLWYVQHAAQPFLHTHFMSLVTLYCLNSRASLKASALWMLSPDGRKFAASQRLPIDDALAARLEDLALVLGLKRTAYTPFSVLDKDDLEAWLLRYAKERGIRSLRTILEQALKHLPDGLLHRDEIELLVAHFHVDLDEVEDRSLQQQKKASQISSGSYAEWLDRHGISEAEADGLAMRFSRRGRVNRFDLVMPLYPGEEDQLAITLDSLQCLLVSNWRLVVVAQTPAPDPIFDQHDSLAWVQVSDMADDAAVAEGFNHVAVHADATHFALLPAGSTLEPHALLMVEDYFDLHPDWQLLYTDHDYRLEEGGSERPQLKPDFDPYYLYSYDYIGSPVFIRRDALFQLGGLNPYPGAELYELLLRCYAMLGDAAIGHLADPLLHLPPARPQRADLLMASRQVAIEQHLAQMGVPARVGRSLHDEVFHVDFALQETPLVSIIIPNRDKIEFLQPCIESLLKRTDYLHYEIVVVDNESRDPDVLKYYQQLQQRLGEQFRLVAYPHPFNFSAQVNLGVDAARGDYIVLLNNDTEVIQGNWLSRMLSLGQQRQVGAVGARLLFPETGKIQHAGVMAGGLPGADVIAHHQFVGMEGNAAGYMNRIWSMQRIMVTAACMLVKKSVYQAVGGFDATNLTVLFNDVDFCLRLEAAGYQNLYQPFASLMHHHGVSISASSVSDMKRHLASLVRDAGEREYMLSAWLPRLAADPAFNRNLDLSSSKHKVSELPASWDPKLAHLPKLLANRLAGGSGEYRIEQPLALLRRQGRMHTAVIPNNHSKGMRLPSPLEIQRLACDGLMLQNPIADMHLFYMEAYRKYLPQLKVFVAIDDLLGAVPEKSGVYVYHQRHFRDARSRLRRALGMADRMIVSTQPLADAFADMIDDIVVVPNRLKKEEWGGLRMPRQPFEGRKLRVGWVGAQQHQGDLELIADVVRQTAHVVDWVFMGMWPEGVDDLIKEKHDPVPFSEYARKVATLALDIALAPLEDNAFNESKSNLRLLEYGAMGWSVICSDVYPYRTNNAPVLRVKEGVESWVAAIMERVADPALAWREGEALHAWVDRHYWLEDHMEDWVRAFS